MIKYMFKSHFKTKQNKITLKHVVRYQFNHLTVRKATQYHELI